MEETKKTYYSISEVCSKTELEPHVLRYWESEFPQLRPKKNRAGNRAYREKDIETIRYIKQLLYEEQYTIPGAKKKLATTKGPEYGQSQLNLFQSNNNGFKDEAIKELREVLKILKS